MENTRERLQIFDDKKLLDVLKNYKQYGYTEATRLVAIELLKDRGFTEEDLRLGGNFANHNFDNAQQIYHEYCRNAAIVFVGYALSLLFIVFIPLLDIVSASAATFMLLCKIVCMLTYSILFVRNLILHLNFYEAQGKKLGAGDQLVYFLFGIPFFVFIYFFYRGQMKEEMQTIK